MTDLPIQLNTALADHYRLDCELGRGGMATVYLAHDLKHDRKVALKVLHPELASTLGPERFQREIRTTARLQHPHILPVLDSGETAGQLWYTMPFVDGESLRDRLVRERQLPLDDALHITREVADALGYAHGQGVVHRDIKPENIMLSRGHALVADFGVARALQSAGADQLTETGMSVGTPAYMSPEQSLGDSALDGRSDLYSLGCVLHEMLAGEPPYSGPSAQAIVAKRLREPIPHVRSVRESVPLPVDQALQQVLAKTAADRFPTAEAFLAALVTPVGSGEGSGTVRPLPTGATRPLRLRIAVALGASMLLLGGTALWLRGRPTPTTALDENVVAVAPFDVLDPSQEIWREGMVDALSRSLDGAGPFRTVSPTTIVRRWRGRADRESAAALGRSSGAGVVVYGSLASAGRDSVRLRASVLDVRRSQVIGEDEVRGPADHIEQLGDSIATAVLRDLGRARPIGTARLSGLGSRSLPALKAFLIGEQAFRRAQWDSAAGAFQQAIDLDSNFALALRRLSVTRGWRFGFDDSLSVVYAERAGEHNHALPPRDSLLVAIDSTMASLIEASTQDTTRVAGIQRLLENTEAATRRYPTDPETWFALGEARVHLGDGLGVTLGMKLEPFARASALDSLYAPAYVHSVALAFAVGDTAGAHRYARAFLRLGPDPDAAARVQLINRMLEEGLQSDAVARMLDSTSANVLVDTWVLLADGIDTAGIGLQLARRFVGKPIGREAWYSDTAERRGMFAVTLGEGGHLREAAAALLTIHEYHEYPLYVELALVGTLSPDSVSRHFEQLLARRPFWPLSGLRAAPAFWAARRDTSALRRYIRELDWRAVSPRPPPKAMTNPYFLRAAAAYLALARGDSTAALVAFAALPRAVGAVFVEQLTYARLLAAAGREAEAFAVLERGFPWPHPSLTKGFWELERARLAEKLGHRDVATSSYGVVAGLWRHADPELQPYVRESKSGLQRLAREPREF